MTIAILEPFSGISGDMTLGALLDVGLDPDWLRTLPGRLGLENIQVRIRRVTRSEIVCQKVDFDIPPQPHGRGIDEIRTLVDRSDAPRTVRERADAVFRAIATAEGEIHGVAPEEVHLHEVGAVDAILDVVGAVWGFEMLGVARVHCGSIALGDGTVRAAHGVLPVPAPATLKLLEGHEVRPGPAGAGELVTPTGAVLVRVLSDGPPPPSYVPVRSGYGAGTKDPAGRPNALRLILAEESLSVGTTSEVLVVLACDIDDMAGEYLAGVSEALREEGALDVVLLPTQMKKGRPGIRVEVLSTLGAIDRLERILLNESTTIGVRRTQVERRSLPRQQVAVSVMGHTIRVKVVTLPSGKRRVKPEYEDVSRVAKTMERPLRNIAELAQQAAERVVEDWVSQPAAGLPADVTSQRRD
jgi:uncharacterized protein (TIGR00299 family) protein